MGVEHQSVFQFGFRVRFCFFRFGFFLVCFGSKSCRRGRVKKLLGLAKVTSYHAFNTLDGWIRWMVDLILIGFSCHQLAWSQGICQRPKHQLTLTKVLSESSYILVSPCSFIIANAAWTRLLMSRFTMLGSSTRMLH